DASMEALQAAHEAAHDLFVRYIDIPTLEFGTTVIELASGCVGMLDVSLKARVTPTTILHTQVQIPNPIIEIWNEGIITLVGPHNGFSERMIKEGETQMKKLVNDWTEAQQYQ